MANLSNTQSKVLPHNQDISTINGLEDRLQGIESDVQNLEDAGYITNEVDDLVNYYKKDETYSKDEVDSEISTAISSVYRYKGSKDTYAELPSSGNVVGDVWNVVEAHGETPAGTNYAWTGSAWDALGGTNDLSDYFNKTEDDSDDITEGSAHLFLTPAERTKLSNTSGTNTGDQSASDFDIKDLADSTNLRDEWSGKQDAISDLSNIRTRAEGSIQATDATFVSNTIAEGADGKVTATAADNVTVAAAETNNKSAIANLAAAHNNLVDRIESLEEGDDEKTKFFSVTLNGKEGTVSDEFITAISFVNFTLGGEPNGYIQTLVEAGKVTVKSTETESNLTVYLMVTKNPAA